MSTIRHMKEYAIEYADCGVLMRLGFMVGGFLLTLVTAVITLSSNEMLFVGSTVAGILIVLAYLLLNPSKIRRNGIILLNGDRIVFGMASGIRIIDLDNLTKCRVSHDIGPRLTLVLKNGSTFRIMANDNFCDTSQLERVCHDIEIALTQFKTHTTNPI